MDTSFPILYSFRRCPYAMRARLALYSAKINHEHREVDLKNKPIEMLEISPKGTVPVLQVGETVLEQSLDIMKWALNISHLSLEETELITENDTTFKQALDRYKYPDRYHEETGITYRDQCEQFLIKFEAQLSPDLTRNTWTLTEMAIFPFIRQFAMVDPEWFNAQSYPYLKLWLDSFISSMLFDQVMQRYPLWSTENQPILVTF
jgi:glutathione S-transferase